MIKISMNINEKEVEKIIDSMPKRFKLKLVRKLGKETFRERWQSIFKDIDKRVKKHPISQKEINDEIKAYRQEQYAQGRH